MADTVIVNNKPYEIEGIQKFDDGSYVITCKPIKDERPPKEPKPSDEDIETA